jgi:hypothetical protein
LAEQVHATAHAGRPDSRLVLALGAVILFGLVARAQASLVPDLMVGDDAAYYLIQVRAILRDGRLAIPDFPLLFYFQAAIALLLSLVMGTEAAIVAAVRWTDAVVPVMLAVPVYLFIRTFTRTGAASSRGVVAMVLVGLLAVASGNALETAGGMIKNATTLPFGLLFVFYLYRGLCDDEGRALAPAGLCFVVSSLTHISGLALCGTLAVLLVLLGLITRATRARLWRPVLVLLAGFVVSGVVVELLDPVRAARLLNPLFHPGWLFADSPLVLWLRGVPSRAIEDAVTSEEIWLGNALGLLGVYGIWRYRQGMDPATRVVLGATTLTTLAFASPVLRPEVLERLALVSYVPGLVPLAYLLCREVRSVVLAAPIAALALLNGALAVKTLRVTTLVRPAYEELVRMKAALPPGNTIVITRHGLEFWMVWIMDTHFSNWAGRALADREAYDAVLVLDEIRQGAFGRAWWPLMGAAPGASLRDGALLRAESVTTLAEGEYFRLSLVEGRAEGAPALR